MIWFIFKQNKNQMKLKKNIATSEEGFIFNPGTENPEFYQLLKSNNIKVEEACTLVLLTTNQY